MTVESKVNFSNPRTNPGEEGLNQVRLMPQAVDRRV
jgi:hypothetical protein